MLLESDSDGDSEDEDEYSKDGSDQETEGQGEKGRLGDEGDEQERVQEEEPIRSGTTSDRVSG